MCNSHHGMANSKQPYQARTMVPVRFLIVVLASSSAISFLAGRAARKSWNRSWMDSRGEFSTPSSIVQSINRSEVCIAAESSASWKQYFDDDHVMSWNFPNQGLQAEGEGKSDNIDEGNDDAGTMATGEHLILDFQGVNRSFLSSEELLLAAMVEFADVLPEFDIGHYECNEFSRTGSIVCGGISLGGDYIWIHSRPKDTVLFIDIYTAVMKTELLSFVPTVERIFGRADDRNGMLRPKPLMRWLHKVRGLFSDALDETDTLSAVDLQWYPIGMFVDYKREVANVKTHFQEISIWDIIAPVHGSQEAFEKSLTADGSYLANHPELFEPDRMVFLDGMLQSRRVGDASYHEALVHPALFAHPNPKRVAIIGGGEGATLREVLKHNTIDEVVMIEIDEMMVNTSRTYLPEWSDCSNIQGRAGNCFDDLKTTLHYEDAFKWFKERFARNSSGYSDKLFDVIIMDALDPQGVQEIVTALYTDREFYQSLYNGLAPEGILIAQVGESSHMDDPFEAFSLDRHLHGFIDGIKSVGFAALTRYEEAGCGFYYPWAFIVASKQIETITETWMANEAVVDLKIRQRTMPTIHGDSSLLFFDGPTMARYRYPTKQMEEKYCLNPSIPESCKPGKREFNPTLFGSETSTNDLDRLIHYIHVEESTDRVLSSCSDLCGYANCENTVLSSYKANFGVNYVKRNGYGLATYHAATASTTSNIIFANDTTSSFDFVGIDIDDIARLRRSFVSPAASNNL